jgi:hypothetical protein
MVAVRLTGYITESGELKIALPEGLPPGEVQVTIEVPVSEETTWTDEEIREMTRIEPKTGAEIVADIKAGLIGDSWKDVGVSGAEWVEEQRRKNWKRNQW